MLISEAITIRSNGGSGKINAFINDFIDMTDDHPFNRKARIYNGVVIELAPFGNEIHISDIVSTQPRSGQGARAVKFLQSLANKHRVTLGLTAKAYSNDNRHITDTTKLVQWYMKLGFGITDDLVYDPNDLEGLEEVEMKYFPR